ncbi:uncharacterized protein SAPINGB_P004418 [Magnusiomyces paraingens]|uniref:TPR-like protein n=1 Tax=Magnusiomyces paraingens TaxID=2606893 RepID=A0A5E8BUD7_9ASCO|nr:uncharacterized protein SAPINGB_P004418 [Saprochaete ingens]VVT55082.1 unnamed protein product [Saprochaete ingens]
MASPQYEDASAYNYMTAMNPNHLEIGNGDEVVTIDLVNDLREDPEEICTLLRNESCDRSYWLAIATAYARLGNVDNAIEIVKTGMEFLQTEEDTLHFLSLLVWLYYRKERDAPNFDQDTGETKKSYRRLATQAANRIAMIDRQSTLGHLTRGELSVLKGDFEGSLNSFRVVLTESSDSNLFGHLGKARVLYSKKNYKGALAIYQLILRSRPNFHPDPRIGIGLCFWHLNDKEMAHAAWKRALELDPDGIAINVLMGLYYMDEAVKNVDDPSFEATYIKALNHIQSAYKANPNYSAADLIIASYLFSKTEMDSVIKLAKRAIDYSNVKPVISDAYFWMARAYHYLDNLEEALKYYKKAEEANPQSLVARVGKGLVLMAQNDSETLFTFEQIVEKNPKSTEALFLLALAYVQRWQQQPALGIEHRDKAITYLEKFMRLSKEQDEAPPIEALLTLAKITEEKNTTTSLNTLNEVIQLIQSQEDIPVKAELYNNIGVLHYTKGSYDSARLFFDMAKKAEEDGHVFHKNVKTSIQYNLARLEDASGNIEKARELYQEILDEHPDYLSARIRLAYLCLALGEQNGPTKVRELMAQHQNNLEVRALYGYYLRRQRRPQVKSLNDDVEMKHYKRTLTEIDKHDTYSMVAIGNLYLGVARGLRVNSDNDLKKKEWTYSKAAEYFERALLTDKNNAFAAQGVAIIFAETKQSDKALQIFSKIRETLNDASIYINMGDCLVDLRQFSKAIECYEIALNRYRRDPQILILLGRAWYARGMTERSMEALKTSLSYSEKAFDEYPENMGLKFNVAFLRFQMADFIQKLAERDRTTKDIEKAIKGLELAIISMKEIAKSRHPPYPPEDLKKSISIAEETTIRRLKRALELQKEYEIKYHDRIDQARKAQLAEKERLAREKEAKAKAEKEREEMLVKERMQLQEQAREWAEKAAAERIDDDEEEEKSTKKRSRGGEKRIRGPRQPRKPREPRKSRKKFKSASDIEDSDEGLDDLEEDPVLDDEEEEEEEAEEAEESAHEATDERPKRRRIMDSDDEE